MFLLVPWFSSLISLIELRGFSSSFYLRFFLNRWLPRSAELVSKKKDNCNVMITGSTNQMILTRDYSHDLDTWPINFILISSHHWYQYPRYHSHVMTISLSLIHHVYTTSIFWSLYHCSTRFQQVYEPSVGLKNVAWRSTRKTTSRSTPI